MKKLVYLIPMLIACFSLSCKDQNSDKSDQAMTSNPLIEFKDIERVEPLNWWVGLKDKSLQLLIKEENIGEATVEIFYSGITISKINKADSPNYLFLDLNIAENTKAGKFNLVFKYEDGTEKKHTYELKEKTKPSKEFVGFNSSDAIFLITPDRFANGDESNDIVEGLKETKINRSDDYARHGGDLKGIINHLDYIHELGYTAIWPTPVLINDMYSGSYHGYAITDYNKVDPRFGTLDDYIELSSKLRQKGMHLIMDQVAHHCGSEHWWMKDLPFNDWVNQQNSFEENAELKNSNHRSTSNQDLYASEKDKQEMNEGWFVSAMPDLNQRNPFMAKYIIQNSIWWIETLQLGGIRQDTYPYSDKSFMANWAGAIMNEYPSFSIVGEEWSLNPLLVGYWQTGAKNKDGYESNLRSTMDFPMQHAIVEALNEPENWDKGLVKIYEGLANDFHYPSPKDIMIFPDNHDMSRIFTQLNEDIANTKMAMAYILTLPRIVQVYYGTEILMNDTAKPGDHGLIRTDFPGGWKGDTVNAFTGEGLSDDQKSMQLFVKKLLNYRKQSKAISEGKTVHFAPVNGIYVMFRMHDDETVITILNKNEIPMNLDLNRFNEIGLKGIGVKNIISGEEFIWSDNLDLKGKGCTLLTTKI
jgi:glycosidase